METQIAYILLCFGLFTVVLFIVIRILIDIIQCKEEEIKYYKNLAKTFEIGYDKLKNKRG